MNILEKIRQARTKKGVRKIIYRSELASKKMGVASVELIENYADALKENKKLYFQLQKIIKVLKTGKPKDIVYKDILDKDILVLLKESRIKQIPSETIFRDYVPLKETGERILTSIKKKLYVPFFIYAMLVIGLNNTMKSFLEVAETGVVNFGGMQVWMMENFVVINFVIGFIFAFFLIIIPTKTPLIKKVFLRIRGMLALSTIRTMSDMAYSSADMHKTLMKQFDIQATKTDRSKNKNNIDKLIELLRNQKMLDLLEGAELKLGAERGELTESVNILLSDKEDEIVDLQEMVNAIVGTLAMLLLTPPVFMIVSVLTTLMANAGG